MIVSLRLVPRGAAAAAVEYSQTRLSTSGGGRRRIRSRLVSPAVPRGLGRSSLAKPLRSLSTRAQELQRPCARARTGCPSAAPRRACSRRDAGQKNGSGGIVPLRRTRRNKDVRRIDMTGWGMFRNCVVTVTHPRACRVRRDRAQILWVVGAGPVGAPVRRGLTLAQRFDDRRLGRRPPAADDCVPCAGRQGDRAVRRRQRQKGGDGFRCARRAFRPAPCRVTVAPCYAFPICWNRDQLGARCERRANVRCTRASRSTPPSGASGSTVTGWLVPPGRRPRIGSTAPLTPPRPLLRQPVA